MIAPQQKASILSETAQDENEVKMKYFKHPLLHAGSRKQMWLVDILKGNKSTFK